MTARILAIDTTSDFGSLALAEGGRIAEEVALHSSEGFGHILFGQIEGLLERHGWAIRGVDCLAAAAGPGSFTGVRVGLAAAKGLADALGKPIVAVSNLRALATFGSRAVRAPLLDARRGEIYGAVYDAAGNLMRDEVVMKFPDWLDQIPAGVEFLSPDPGLFLPSLRAAGWEDAMLTGTPRQLAAAVARIAARDFLDGRAQDPSWVDANYVRRPDAELLWKDE
ncbi:MAG: tRNA (adenosine(37)-N6)-threonylcarbamoyltransferase complex dimerization subunit type 1 TsaB [Bryobacterales bacterium]|nr:tRNA (adenosine(37)-N6)-threonylcarbamoyltransferase complex dimerization subunit type 1 TsaB [Bryobacterales bacterium]